MTRVVTFNKALKEADQYSKKNLLLGNGFSIACVPTIFTYKSLFEQADFSQMPEALEVFTNLNTEDFEEVIHALESASLVLPAYKSMPNTVGKMKLHAAQIKEILIQTIAGNHPEKPSRIDNEKYSACVEFLNNFLDSSGAVYSLNYDLLLYWTLMFGLEANMLSVEPNDGFGKNFLDDEYGVEDYVVWQGDTNQHGQNIHYLHGALHVFDSDTEVEKFTWSNTGIPLIDQTREALSNDKFPLFVAEGDSRKKLAKIKHSAYLYHSYKSFAERMKQGAKTSCCLFTYGVSFSANDAHITQKIAKGKCSHLFVSIYGDPKSPTNNKIIDAVEELKRKRSNPELMVTYYDAASAKVWG